VVDRTNFTPVRRSQNDTVPFQAATRTWLTEIMHQAAGDRPGEAAFQVTERFFRGNRIVRKDAGELRYQPCKILFLGGEPVDLRTFLLDLRLQGSQQGMSFFLCGADIA
jgi:hypothetical protein